MPYLNVRIAQQESAGVADQVVSALMKRTAEILGKKPEVTSIEIDFISPDRWFVGHVRISDQDATTFYLDIKITEGTNTKQQKAEYIKAVFADFESILGGVTPASYIVIHDVSADSWGFEGKTQEYRFINARSL
jgi:4-oxalocrotonate tautomerase